MGKVKENERENNENKQRKEKENWERKKIINSMERNGRVMKNWEI